MSIKLNFLFLSIYFACVNPQLNNGPSSTSKDTIEEFGTKMADWIKKRCFSSIEKGEFKDILRSERDKFEMDVKERNFLDHFDCFINTIKPDCELAFGYFKNRDFKQNKTVIHQEFIKLPKFFQTLDDQNDKWLHDGITPPAGFILNTSDEEDKPRKIPKLVTYYQQWFYIVTFKMDRLKLLPPWVTHLRIELQSFYRQNKKYYRNYNQVLRRFAGHIARTYIMACELHHPRSKRILWAAMILNNHKQFSEVLLDLIPTWYFDEEQLVFLQILHSALFPSKNVFSNNRGKMLTATNDFEKIVIRNKFPLENGGQWVLIPYLDARNCARQNISAFSMVTVPISKQRHYMPPLDNFEDEANWLDDFTSDENDISFYNESGTVL